MPLNGIDITAKDTYNNENHVVKIETMMVMVLINDD